MSTLIEVKKKVKCSRCGYEWYTRSKHKYVTCPSCLRKFRVDDTEVSK